MFTFTINRLIKNAPAHIVWDVIADIERYADYAPNLSHAEKTSDGPTPSRRCYDTKGRGWDEACVLWHEGEAYSFEVDTSAADYPYPFRKLQGTWAMAEEAGGVRVTMRFDYTPKTPPLLGWLVNRAMRRSFQPVAEQLLDNWEAEIRAHMTRQVTI